MTGAEKAHCQIYQDEVIAVHRTGEDSDQTSGVESAGSDASFNQKAMERRATSETGSVKARFHLFHSRSEVHEMEVVREQMMGQREMVSEIAERHQLHGVKGDHKVRKMAARDLRDVSSKNDLLLSEPPLLLSKTTNGAQRCDPTQLLLNLPSHPAMVVKLLLPLHLQLLSQQADQN